MIGEYSYSMFYFFRNSILIVVTFVIISFIISGFFKFGPILSLFILLLILLFVSFVFIRNLIFILKQPYKIYLFSDRIEFLFIIIGRKSLIWNELLCITFESNKIIGISIKGPGNEVYYIDKNIKRYTLLYEQLSIKVPHVLKCNT
jgi:hypothetical protein